MLEVTKCGDREDGLSKKKVSHFGHCVAFDWLRGVFPKNVWVGTSVEDQQRADERIPELLNIPAKIRFLSCEPLLGPIDLNLLDMNEVCEVCHKRVTASAFSCAAHCDCCVEGDEAICWGGLHWVIVGGESGKQARQNNLSWVRSLVQQCGDNEVPCFVKQLGGNLSDWDLSDCGLASGKSMAHPKGGDPLEWPESLRVREFPTV